MATAATVDSDRGLQSHAKDDPQSTAGEQGAAAGTSVAAAPGDDVALAAEDPLDDLLGLEDDLDTSMAAELECPLAAVAAGELPAGVEHLPVQQPWEDPTE